MVKATDKTVYYLFINGTGRKGITFKELALKTRMTKRKDRLKVKVDQLIDNGSVIYRKGKLYTAKALQLKKAIVDRVQKTFGFVKLTNNEDEYFIPGKFLLGALPGDVVLIKDIPTKGATKEGKVVQILEKGSAEFTGVLLQDEGQYFVLPDNFTKTPIMVVKNGSGGAKPGDKVLAKVVVRKENHYNHKCKILSAFGDAQTASACVDSILQSHGIPLQFPVAVLDEANYVSSCAIPSHEIDKRLDLRDDIIFTIDGADSKDLDDAISLDKRDDVYHLGVHIADVSYYVQHHSALDEEAFNRGTSVYFANRVIPMLPKELSNGICSLNPWEDRLAFSAFLVIDLNGHLLDFDFKKTVIRSRVKGVYSEVNALLEGSATDKIQEKYAQVHDKIHLMHELAQKLEKIKLQRGAPQIHTTESKILVDEKDKVIDVKPRETGVSEGIIEEFMLLANEAAATLAKKANLPFVYRIHEIPPEEKVQNLREILGLLGFHVGKIKRGMRPNVLADILRKAEGTKEYSIVNRQVLRSMSKAKYSVNPVGHYGLALENYAHFTSPIRRYPDLTIHRILSEYLDKKPEKVLYKKYGKFAERSAVQSSSMEMKAMNVERDCEDSYKAEYMKKHIGEVFSGMVSSMTNYGIYVELPNTIEGMIKMETLPGGEYAFDGMLTVQSPFQKRKFRIGDEIQIECTNADVNAGNVDFILVEK